MASAQPEPFGGVVIEAMAYGLPVIGTAVGGTVEQVEPGRTGFLIPPADPAALAEKVALLRDNPQLRQRMGAAGRQRVIELFSIDTMVGRIKRIYDAALAVRRPAPFGGDD